MENWQFLLEAPGQNPIVVPKNHQLQILPSKYRIIAHSCLKQTFVEICLKYQTETEDLQQKYLLQTHQDGSLIITPFLDLTPGTLRLRASADLLAELVDEYWQAQLELFILDPALPSSLVPWQTGVKFSLEEDLLVQQGESIYLSAGVESAWNYTAKVEAQLCYRLYNPKTGYLILEHQEIFSDLSLPANFSCELALSREWETSCLLTGEAELSIRSTEGEEIITQSKCFSIILPPRQLQYKLRKLQAQLNPQHQDSLDLFNVRELQPTEVIPLVSSSKVILPPKITSDLPKKQPLKLPPVASTKSPTEPTEQPEESDLIAQQLQQRFWSRLSDLVSINSEPLNPPPSDS